MANLAIGLKGISNTSVPDPSRVGSGTESYGYHKNKGLFMPAMEDYTPPHLHRITVEMTQSVQEFDPKLFDIREYCPVFTIGKTESGGNVYYCAINKSINLIHDYVNLLNVLYEATDKDIIELNVDSPGGYIATATQICTAIRQCKARVWTHASGICASAGSLIWSVGHEVSVGDFALFMWHMSSHSDWGNSILIKNEAEFQIDYVRETLLSISVKRKFITMDEVSDICTNPDVTVWIHANQMRERIEQAAKEAA